MHKPKIETKQRIKSRRRWAQHSLVLSLYLPVCLSSVTKRSMEFHSNSSMFKCSCLRPICFFARSLPLSLTLSLHFQWPGNAINHYILHKCRHQNRRVKEWKNLLRTPHKHIHTNACPSGKTNDFLHLLGWHKDIFCVFNPLNVKCTAMWLGNVNDTFETAHANRLIGIYPRYCWNRLLEWVSQFDRDFNQQQQWKIGQT